MASEALYFDSREYFEDLKRHIQNAQHSVDIEVYIWAADTLGDELLKLLVEAADRGIKVRLLVDGIGSLYWLQTRMSSQNCGEVQVRIFNPLHRLWAVHRWPKFNRRTHRKIFLIDQKILFTGSMNVMKESYGWRETGLRLESSSVVLVQKIFDFTWRMTKSKIFRFFSSTRSQLFKNLRRNTFIRSNQFFRLRGYFRKDLVKRIKLSKQRVWLTTPYFNPPVKLLRALVRASRRGVDVKLLLPGRSDIFFAPWIGQLHYKLLLKWGIEIYEYSPQILHAKVSLIDKWCSVGSSNLNYRSFKNDLELDVVLASPESVLAIERQFEIDMQHSKKITSIQDLSIWKRLLARFVYRFWRWM